MKIGINARFLAHPYSGIGIYTKNIIRALADLDKENEYHIACHKKLEETSLNGIKLPKNFHFHRVPQKGKGTEGMKKSYWEMVQLPKFFKKLGVDIVHSTYPNLAAYKSQKHVVTVHDIIPWILPGYVQSPLSKLYHRASKRRTKKADHVVTVSDFSKKEIAKFLKIPEENITITPNAVDIDFHSKKGKGEKQERKYLIYIGGFDKRKNISQVVDVFNEHIAPKHDIDLVIVGDKLHQTRLYDDIHPDTRGRIKKTGFVSEEEKKHLLENAEALIHLSLYEGFNIPVLEALHVGTPVLISNIPPHREVAGEHAVYLDVTDEAAMAKRISDFLKDENEKERLSEGGRMRAEEFNWERSAQTLLDLYNRIRPHKKLWQ
jgi:glycosyltransferase involved in cell wall biosynthesis